MKQIRRFKELLESSPYNCSIGAVILLFSLTHETIALEIKRGENKRRLGRRRLPAENDRPRPHPLRHSNHHLTHLLSL